MAVSKDTERPLAVEAPSAVASIAAEPLLGSTVRVTLVDGRILLGTLTCIDSDANLVLHRAEKYKPPEEVEAESASAARLRWLGPVMIGQRHIERVEVDAEALDGANQS